MESTNRNDFLQKNILSDKTALVLKEFDRNIAVTPSAFARLIGTESNDLSSDLIERRIKALLGIFYHALGKAGAVDSIRFTGLKPKDRTQYVALRWMRSEPNDQPSYTIMTAQESKRTVDARNV